MMEPATGDEGELVGVYRRNAEIISHFLNDPGQRLHLFLSPRFSSLIERHRSLGAVKFS